MNNIEKNRYSIIAGDRYLELEQNKDEIVFYCTQTEFDSFWMNYFDLHTDYGKMIYSVDREEEYLYQAVRFGSGIRILNQDPWEMIVSFIISQQNNIKRIRKCISLLCERYGEEKQDYKNEIYHAFPRPEVLAAAREEDLRACNLGYRSKYIRKTAESIVNQELIIENLSEMNYEDAKRELLKLSGVGNKVADCICLFGLHQVDAFPVDTHIRQVLDAHYPDGFNFDKYNGYAGIMQQYLFYYDLNKKWDSTVSEGVMERV